MFNACAEIFFIVNTAISLSSCLTLRISRSTEGSGLGLSIAQNLTTLQKGTFEIYLDGDLFKVQIGFSCLDVPQPEIEIQMR